MGKNTNPLIEALYQNRHLQTPAEASAFDAALQNLAQSKSEEDLPQLLAVFTDDYQHPEVMYGLVHCVESFEISKYCAALVEAAPSMKVQAPDWIKSLHCHILNDSASRAAYKNAFQSASRSARDAAKAVLFEIQEDPDFSSHVREVLS